MTRRFPHCLSNPKYLCFWAVSDRSERSEGATANRFIDPAVWPLSFAHDSAGGGGGSSLPAGRVPRGLDVSRSAAIPKFSRVPMSQHILV